MASFKVSFRVVGTYCYYQAIDLGELYGLTPANTVRDILDKFVEYTNGQFSYSYGPIDNGHIVTNMAYDFEKNSKVPYNTQYTNTGNTPDFGQRAVNQQINQTVIDGAGGPFSTIWQYKRTVTGVVGEVSCEIEINSADKQTPFDQRTFEDQLELPEGFSIESFNLTWRMMAVNLNAEKEAQFKAAEHNLTHVTGGSQPGYHPGNTTPG